MPTGSGVILLLEEAREAGQATPDELAKEIADLYEVIDALLEAYQIPREIVFETQTMRRRERGGFKNRLRLHWTEPTSADLPAKSPRRPRANRLS